MGARLFFVLAISLLTLTPAQGRAEESCTQAKDLVKAVKAFYGNKADLTDTIDPQLNINLKGINGQPDPSELLYRFEKTEHRLPIKAGRVEGLESGVSWSKQGELCSLYEKSSPPKSDEPTVNLTVSFHFPYRETNVLMEMPYIKNGMKDGSKIIKSLAPSGLGFAAPSLKTLIIGPQIPEHDIPKITFLRDGQAVGVQIAQFNRDQYIRFKDLKSGKIDALKIEGPYQAHAFFKIDPEKLAEQEVNRLKKLAEDEN